MSHIRPANADDYNAIIELFESWKPQNYDTPSAVKYYQNFFSESPCCRQDTVFVCEEAGHVVGVTGYCPDDEAEDVYWLNWYFVRKNLTRQGHGRFLLDYVIKDVKENGARKLYVDTSDDPFYVSAVRLYKAVGFKEEARLKDFYEDGEDQIILGLYLNTCVP